MKTILRSGWFNVSSFVYAFLMFVGVCCSSLVFGTEMNPLMSPPTSAVASHSKHNPYQAIYDAYLSGTYLDDASMRQITNFYAAKSTPLEYAKNGVVFQKKFLMLVGMKNITEGFFDGQDSCKYDQHSISERSILRKAVKRILGEEVSNSHIKNALFTYILKIDEYQDLNRLDDVLDNLQSLVRDDYSDIDSSFHAYFRQWLYFIKAEKEEEDTNVLIRRTLQESASKTYATERIERFIPIMRFLVLAGGGIGGVYLTLTQPVSSVMTMNNLYNVSFSNITANDSRLIFINLCNITLGPLFELNETKFISSLNGTTFDIAEKTYANPVNKYLMINTFLTAIILSAFDFFYNAVHHIVYYFFLLWGTNIESIPNSIRDLLEQEAKKIKNTEDRKEFIKIIGNYIGEKLKKTWSQEWFVKDVTEQINLVMQDEKQGV